MFKFKSGYLIVDYKDVEPDEIFRFRKEWWIVDPNLEGFAFRISEKGEKLGGLFFSSIRNVKVGVLR